MAENNLAEQQEQERYKILIDIAELLVHGPVYGEVKYSGTAQQFDHTNERNEPVYDSRRVLSFPYCRMFCPSCKQDTWWQTNMVHSASAKGYDTVAYNCRNCGGETMRFWYVWTENNGNGYFLKAGQHPPLETRVPTELHLTPENKTRYQRAVICRQFSFGLAALAYLRRVVEDEMDDLLELVIQAAKASNVISAVIQKVIEAKEGHSFDDKVNIAAEALPADLKQGGHNPLYVLCGISSAGMHNETEQECLQRFDDVRYVFEYLFRNLRTRNEEAAAYATRLGQLTQNIRTPSKDQPPK